MKNPLISFALGLGAAYLIWGMRRSSDATAAQPPVQQPGSTAVTQPASTMAPTQIVPRTFSSAPAPSSQLTAYSNAL